jgi:hypothetical protein
MFADSTNYVFIVNFEAVKKVIIVLVVFLLSTPVISQVHFGFKAGAGITRSTNRPYYPYTTNPIEPVWQPGYVGGITMDVEVSDIFFLQWDLMYSQTNTLYNLDSDIYAPDQSSPGKSELTTSINSVQMPIVVRFATYDKKVTSYFETGFYGGYAIDGTYKITAAESSYNQSGNYVFDDYKRGDFGFVIGGGFGTKMGKKGSWALNLRYLFSTFDTRKSPDDNNSDYVKSQNRMLYLTLILFVI